MIPVRFVTSLLLVLLGTLLLLVACGGKTSESPNISETSKKAQSPIKVSVAPTTSPVPSKALVTSQPTQISTTVPNTRAKSQPTAAPAASSVATAEPTEVPTAAPVPKPTATTAAVVSKQPADGVTGFPQTSGMDPEKYVGTCTDLSYEEQKIKLVKIVDELFVGITNSDDRERLHQIPHARDSRRGGIWISIMFNGDETDDLLAKKTRLDLQMRDAYQALYNSGCADLGEVDITAIQEEITTREIGASVLLPIVVFKTRLKKADAENVDWSNKGDIDFNEVWDQLVLNPRWRKGLREIRDGG